MCFVHRAFVTRTKFPPLNRTIGNISACLIVVLVFPSLHGFAFSDQVAAGGGGLHCGIAFRTSRCLLNKRPAQGNWLDPAASSAPTPSSTHRLAGFITPCLQTERSIALPQDMVPKVGLQTPCPWWRMGHSEQVKQELRGTPSCPAEVPPLWPRHVA